MEANQHAGIYIAMSTRVLLGAAVAAILFFGILPGPALDLARNSVSTLVGAGSALTGLLP